MKDLVAVVLGFVSGLLIVLLLFLVTPMNPDTPEEKPSRRTVCEQRGGQYLDYPGPHPDACLYPRKEQS